MVFPGCIHTHEVLKSASPLQTPPWLSSQEDLATGVLTTTNDLIGRKLLNGESVDRVTLRGHQGRHRTPTGWPPRQKGNRRTSPSVSTVSTGGRPGWRRANASRALPVTPTPIPPVTPFCCQSPSLSRHHLALGPYLTSEKTGRQLPFSSVTSLPLPLRLRAMQKAGGSLLLGFKPDRPGFPHQVPVLPPTPMPSPAPCIPLPTPSLPFQLHSVFPAPPPRPSTPSDPRGLYQKS